MSNGKNELSKRTIFLIGLIILTLLVAGFILIRNISDNNTSSDNKSAKEENKKPNPSDTPNNPPLPEQPNNKYPALIATKKEREYKFNPPLAISSVGCGTDRPDLFTYSEGHLVAGSALITDTVDGSGSGSSILNSKEISHIIHAINQPFSSFNNNEELFIGYVVRSVQNSIILADRNNFEKLAIPLVGGGIYLGSCDPQKLAESIIRGSVNQLEKCQNLKSVIFVDWKGNKIKYFEKVILENYNNEEIMRKWVGKVSVMADGGDIRDKNLHGASVIVNAANTQVKFGSGVSGAIAEQVGDKTKIETKARELIDKFNS